MAGTKYRPHLGKLGLEILQGVLHAPCPLSFHLYVEAVLVGVDIGYWEVIAHVVQVVGGDEPRVEQQLRGRLRVERPRVVDDEKRMSTRVLSTRGARGRVLACFSTTSRWRIKS